MLHPDSEHLDKGYMTINMNEINCTVNVYDADREN